MLSKKYLGADDDWIQPLRGWLYPKLNGFLKKYGGYSVGVVTNNQFVGYLPQGEEVVERELEEAGAFRNPIAALKTHHPTQRKSRGSWVVLHEDAPDLVEEDMQLHFTLFRGRGGRGIELFAHYEYDWRANPIKHLHEKKLDERAGVEKARQFIDEETYLAAAN